MLVCVCKELQDLLIFMGQPSLVFFVNAMGSIDALSGLATGKSTGSFDLRWDLLQPLWPFLVL